MENKINYNTTLVDTKTGEVINIEKGTKIISPKRQEEIKEYAQKNCLTLNEKNIMYEATHQLRGQFYSIPCKEVSVLWENVTEPTLGKLIYLATFIDNNNCICFDGGWDEDEQTVTRVSIPMAKQDIQATLKVHRNTFASFWKECITKQLIIEKNNCYYLPKDKFRFCNSSEINKSKTSMVKMFKHAIRYMYEHTDERSKKTLVYLYRLIPFINLTYNGLCENPFESDKSKIKRLPLDKICEMFGIDSSHQSRFLNKLKKLRFIDKQGIECSVIRYNWLYYDRDIYWITINPQFYSGYISEDAMIEMVNEFRLKDNEIL